MEGTQPSEKKRNLHPTDLLSVPRSSEMQTRAVIHDNTHRADSRRNKPVST